MHGLKITTIILVAGLLGACASSKPNHYYTLLSPAPATQVSGTAAAKSEFAISVQPVQVPEQVDKPQIVVSDPNSTQVIPLNNSLWASPLSDEIRNALSAGISRRLGVLDVAVTGAPEQLPVWRITLNVQRFDSVYGERVLIDATWRLSPVRQPGKKTALCRAESRAEVGEGMSALVAGHQSAIQQLSELIAKQLRGDQTAVSDGGLTLKGCTFS